MNEVGPALARRDPWEAIREQLHERGLRWTPQRRTLVAVLAETRGHVTGSELIERCRARDPGTVPSTVYRTLDVLEDLGLVRHGHGPDGREEYHVLPDAEHGHLHCSGCGATWEITAAEGEAIVASFEAARGFAVDLSHVTVVGHCSGCRPEP
jgi:Fur family transcriptional regulator, ferric uptake regulator